MKCKKCSKQMEFVGVADNIATWICFDCNVYTRKGHGYMSFSLEEIIEKLRHYGAVSLNADSLKRIRSECFFTFPDLKDNKKVQVIRGKSCKEVLNRVRDIIIANE